MRNAVNRWRTALETFDESCGRGVYGIDGVSLVMWLRLGGAYRDFGDREIGVISFLVENEEDVE